MLAVPWPAMETVAQSLGDLSGKVVIDMSWPPTETAEDGYTRFTLETSAAEMIQAWQIAFDLGLDSVDAGPLRFARNIELLTELSVVPWYQGRDELWHVYFPRSNYVPCRAANNVGVSDQRGWQTAVR